MSDTMYQAHFGLRETPFGTTPDTAFVYDCRAHQEVLNVVLVALDSGDGFIKSTGDVGTGKTLLCRRDVGSREEVLDGVPAESAARSPWIADRPRR